MRLGNFNHKILLIISRTMMSIDSPQPMNLAGFFHSKMNQNFKNIFQKLLILKQNIILFHEPLSHSFQ